MYAVVLLVCCSWVALLCPSAQAYENLALHQPAWQSSTWETNTGVYLTADLAVDGRYTDMAWYGGSCAVSYPVHQATAEWWVDLGGVKNIHQVFIHYLTGDEMWDEGNYLTQFFLGFSVYISNTTNKENGVLCFRDTNYTNATIPNPVNITCPYHGRYVIYYNNRTNLPYPEGYSNYAYNELCELEVLGCPTSGFYGENCSLPCPQNCQKGQCHITEGTCLGCLPGYLGHKCDEECKNKKYGLECNQTCGNCTNGEPCHHVNGSCLNGCDVGVFGDKCDQGCPRGVFGDGCLNNCSLHCKVPMECDRITGRCFDGCKPGWSDPTCNTKVQLRYISQENETMSSAFYSVLVLFVLSVICNVLCAIRLSRNTACWRHREEIQQEESGLPIASHNPREIYDQVEKTSDYQELGDVSKPTIYETLT